MLNKKLLLTAIALSTIISSGAIAATQDIGASVTAHGAISLSNVQDMNFGHIDYAVTHSGGLRLGTNGNITKINHVGLVLSGTTSAGSFDIASDGSTMEISCEQEGTLSNSNGDTLNIGNIEITNGVGGEYGTATACRGIGSEPLIASNLATIKVGANLASLNNNLKSGTYSTANAGGSPITVSVVYQ